jgi:hypothetical protein
MTSFRQIEANRRNASKSTGPVTAEGKERSRCNAVRHGLTAETVIGALEDAEDYKSFEAAVTADYNAQTAVERELVLRLASLLWRLRRATAMETGLLEIQAEHIRDFRAASDQVIFRSFGQTGPIDIDVDHWPDDVTISPQIEPTSGVEQVDPARDLARCFLRLVNLSGYPIDRLSRYEATLWRQVAQILFALDALGRRRPWGLRP